MAWNLSAGCARSRAFRDLGFSSRFSVFIRHIFENGCPPMHALEMVPERGAGADLAKALVSKSAGRKKSRFLALLGMTNILSGAHAAVCRVNVRRSRRGSVDPARLKWVRENSVVPLGLELFVRRFPALARWAKLVRPSGAGFSVFVRNDKQFE